MGASNLEVTVASHDALDVRHFAVQEGMSQIFNITLTAVSRNANIDFDSIVGQDASFTLRAGQGAQAARVARPLLEPASRSAVEEHRRLDAYQLTLVPTLWLLSHRRNHRMFQQLSEVEIVQKLLARVGDRAGAEAADASSVQEAWKYKVQYAESDFDFGLAAARGRRRLVPHFRQEGRARRSWCSTTRRRRTTSRPLPIPFVDKPNRRNDYREHVTGVTVHQRVRPGKLHGARSTTTACPPTLPAQGGGFTGGAGVEAKLESFHYVPGAFLFRSEGGRAVRRTPTTRARRAATRRRPRRSRRSGSRRSAAQAKRATFHSNVVGDRLPGTVLRID